VSVVTDALTADGKADVVAYNGYFPFGMLLPNRYGSSSGYRYGYQGSEKDNEIKGLGNSYTTHFRQLDPRIGRWLSVDPEAQKLPWHSSYISMSDNPIRYTDKEGDIFGIDNLVGAVVGAAIEVSTQIAVNSLTGKDLFDLDYADVAVEAGMGFATSGVSNVLKAGKTTMRIVNAARTVKKSVNSNKIAKAALKVAPEIAKASVDASIDKGVETIADKKALKDFSVDVVAGITGGKIAEGVGEIGTAVVNRGGKKALKKLTKRAKGAITNSPLQKRLQSRASFEATAMKQNKNFMEVSSKIGIGATAGKKAEEVKK